MKKIFFPVLFFFLGCIVTTHAQLVEIEIFPLKGIAAESATELGLYYKEGQIIQRWDNNGEIIFTMISTTYYGDSLIQIHYPNRNQKCDYCQSIQLCKLDGEWFMYHNPANGVDYNDIETKKQDLAIRMVLSCIKEIEK